MIIRFALVFIIFVQSIVFAQVSSCNNDSICSAGYETCLSCPNDCTSCSFSGAALYSYSGIDIDTRNIISTRQLQKPSIVNWFASQIAPVSGLLTGFVSVEKSGLYYFKVTANNIGGKIIVNGADIITFECQDSLETKTHSLYFKKSKIVKIEVSMFSVSNETRNISLNWKKPTSVSWEPLDDIFYSQNVCGDGIKDLKEESSCDPFGEVFNSNETKCSNTVCSGNDKNTCFIGCHEVIGSLCPAIPIPPGHISPGLPVRDDSLGSLIENQFLWKLPGIEHIGNGFNIISGVESTLPIFSYGFCDNSINQTVQDTYRGNVYIIPDGLFAQPEPTCTFDVKTEKYRNSLEVSKSFAEAATENANANLGTKLFGFGISSSLAFSKSKAVETVNKLTTEKRGEIISADLVCKTSRVQIDTPKFHPIFLRRLASINSTSEETAINDIIDIFNVFGTHYYKKATLGGKLSQYTIVETNAFSNVSSKKLDDHVELSFSASVSSPFFSASGGYGNSIDTSVSSEEQREFENSTLRSTIITYGGAPGSFGPSSDGSPSNYGEWARTVDLLPIPVEYELDRIANILDERWYLENNISIRNVWIKAEQLYFEKEFLDMFDENNYLSNRNPEYIIQWNASMNTQSEYCWSYKLMNNDEILGMNEIFLLLNFGQYSGGCIPKYLKHLFLSNIFLNSPLPYDVRNTSLIIDTNEFIQSDIRSDVFNQVHSTGFTFLFDGKYSRVLQFNMADEGKPMNLSSVKDMIVIQSYCYPRNVSIVDVRVLITGTLNFVEYKIKNFCPASNRIGVTLSIPLTHPIGVPQSISVIPLIDLNDSSPIPQGILQQLYAFIHPCKVFPEICEIEEQKEVTDYYFNAFGLAMDQSYVDISPDMPFNGPLVPLDRVHYKVGNFSLPIDDILPPSDENPSEGDSTMLTTQNVTPLNKGKKLSILRKKKIK